MTAVLRHPSAWLAASALAAALLLVFGPVAWNEAPLPGGLPVGNALTVVVLVNASMAGWLYSAPGTLLRLLSTVAVSVAVGWMPVSIAISGNLANTFSGDDAAFMLWFRFTAVAAVLALATLVATLAASIVDRRRARGVSASPRHRTRSAPHR